MGATCGRAGTRRSTTTSTAITPPTAPPAAIPTTTATATEGQLLGGAARPCAGSAGGHRRCADGPRSRPAVARLRLPRPDRPVPPQPAPLRPELDRLHRHRVPVRARPPLPSPAAVLRLPAGVSGRHRRVQLRD